MVKRNERKYGPSERCMKYIPVYGHGYFGINHIEAIWGPFRAFYLKLAHTLKMAHRRAEQVKNWPSVVWHGM